MKTSGGSLRKYLESFCQISQQKESRQITTIRNEREDITTDATDIKKVIRRDLKHKFDNLVEIDHFVKNYQYSLKMK